MDRRVPQRAFGVGQLSTPFVQYTEQTAEQCEIFTDSEVLRISETRNSRHTSSNGSVKNLELTGAQDRFGTTQGLRKQNRPEELTSGLRKCLVAGAGFEPTTSGL